MKIKEFFDYIAEIIRDPERDFSERVFLIFSIISEIAVLIALAGDIYIGENLGEIFTLIGVVILVPLITFIGLIKNRMRFAIVFFITSLILVILPMLFFFGGGIRGGGIIWVIFAFMYVGLVVTGKWRKLLLALIILEAFGFYAAVYYFPELAWGHTLKMDYIDSFISLIMVGVVCFAMTWFQNRLFMLENNRAKKEAERAEELTRSQNRFFSSMSHEIRTPINSILGLNELILRDQTASDEIAKDAAGIQGAGKLLLALINDILDFSKMEAGSMDIVPVDYRIGDMLSEIVNMIWLKAHDKGLKFDVRIDPKVPSVLYGDEVRIKQVIINLLNNAVKYTAEGSVELYVESEHIDDKTTLLNIQISDTGMGIKKEALPYLFDAFKRVDEEKNRYIEGTGLGLSIVKQIVELMDGEVTVNSVYGEGSTFTVTLKQGITNSAQIGELNIHSQQTFKRDQYESSFKAPDAKILIVDDNKMNLEVEKKLLYDTELTIDTVLSGKEALELSLKNRYDVIFMDHLMPEMDGIDCLERLRNQSGGLNRTTPVIVLTANAGSENRDLYNRSGFDGYLIKPVSGETLEEMLIKHISKDKLIISNKFTKLHDNIHTASGYSKKLPVLITTSSMADLPDAVIKKLNLPIIPFRIRTDEGVFKDGIQMDAYELIRYLRSGRNAVSSPQDVKAYTDFFAEGLKKAHHVIHIALTSDMSMEYKVASEAARSFDNVTVINSECLSSSTGILALIAYKLTQLNMPVQDIVKELETVKKRLRCSFVINTTEFMASRGLLSKRVDVIARSLNLHPCLRMKNDKSGIGGVWAGSTKRAYKKYIHNAFPVDIIPDSDVVFITYADIAMDTLLWIKEEISKIAYFEHVIFKQASAGISSNCGSGTFGILYFVKSNKSYNIGSLLSTEHHVDENDDVQEEEREHVTDAEVIQTAEELTNGVIADDDHDHDEESMWYHGIEQIDGKEAIRNSGSEEAFRSVLKIFYDSIDAKAAELNGYYEAKDWDNYTIKIHALKSSAKLIGALELSDEALALETAGKDKDIEFITSCHEDFMNRYVKFKDVLYSVFEVNEQTASDDASDKPIADEYLLKSVYEELHSAAEDMDYDMIEQILHEMDDYSIPDDQATIYRSIVEKAGKYDYDGIIDIIDKM